MSYVDNGDDELDYEDEDYPEPSQPYGNTTGAIAALAEDEMEEEEDYDDLYQDVDVGFFENPEAAQGAVQGDAAGEQFPGGAENGVEEYGEEDYGEEYEGVGRGGASAMDEEGYPEEEQPYGDDGEQDPGLDQNDRNVRAKTEGDDYGQQQDYAEEEEEEPIAEEEEEGIEQPPKIEEVEEDAEEEDVPLDIQEEKPSVKVETVSEPSVAAAAALQAERKTDIGEVNSTRSVVPVVLGAVVVKTEETDYGEADSQVGKGGGGAGTVATVPRAEVKMEFAAGSSQPRTELQIVTSAPERINKSAGRVNGSGSGPSSSEGGAGRGIRADGGATGSWAGPSGKSGGISGPPTAAATPTPPPAANKEAATTASDYMAKHGSSHQHESGGIMLFVGELHWWTTDAELEAALSEYGRLKNIKFFEEKASGRSKGYCQVEFYEAGAARVCKEKMDGRIFNDRACVVAFASPQTIKQMGAAQVGKNQTNNQSHGSAGGPGRGRGEPGSGGRGGVSGSHMGEGGRGYGREKMLMGGRGGGPGERGRGSGRGGRGGNIGGRGGGGGGAHFGQGPPGPMGGGPGMMPPQGMMGGGFDPAFGPPMGGRGGGYGMGPGGPGGGFGPRAHPFGGGPGMGPPFPTMGPGLPGVAPHVNPAFFGRANGNGPGMGMDGPAGGWGEGPMPGWVGEEHERRMVYGDEMVGPDYGYPGEMGPDRLRAGPPRERDRVAEGDWPGVDRRRREDRGDGEWAGERHRERGAREEYWDREPGREKEKDWPERERVPRGREKSRAAAVDDEERPRSRDEDFGKRRRMVADRKVER